MFSFPSGFTPLHAINLRACGLPLVTLLSLCSANASASAVIEIENLDMPKISADGKFIAGRAGQGFVRWSEDSGATTVTPKVQDYINHRYYLTNDISGDGSVVVGDTWGAVRAANGAPIYYRHAYIWTADGATRVYDVPEMKDDLYSSASANAVSVDGNVVVGWAEGLINGTSREETHAFRWTAAEGSVSIGEGSAADVSSTGEVIVGTRYLNTANSQAFRWTIDEGMVDLGTLLNHQTSYASAVSADGNVIVGASDDGENEEAFRWTNDLGMIGLGTLDGATDSRANALTTDGSVIVGQSGNEAFYWSQSNGLQSLASILEGAGLDLGSWSLETASDISADGAIIVGTGSMGDRNSVTYRADLLLAAFINNHDFQQGIDDLRHSQSLLTQSARAIARLSLPQAPRLDAQESWSLSPLISYAPDNNLVLGGIVSNWASDAYQVNLAVGLGKTEEDAWNGGTISMDGYWVALGSAVDISKAANLNTEGIELSASISQGFFEEDLERRYLNGANYETSSGSADADAQTATLRLGWRIQQQSNVHATPYIQLLHSSNTIEAYDETGGVYSGSVEQQQSSNVERSLGVLIDWKLREDIILSAGAALYDLKNHLGDQVVIDIERLGTRTSTGSNYDERWEEINLGLSWKLTERLQLVSSANLSNGSNYPEKWSISAALNYALAH